MSFYYIRLVICLLEGKTNKETKKFIAQFFKVSFCKI